MSNPTRQRLIEAALELFLAQGVTQTTTRQIATLADVNEVTLFRQFGNKYGLLRAVIEESSLFSGLQASLLALIGQSTSLQSALESYANASLQQIQDVPEFMRSLIGEASQYPLENRQALGQNFAQFNQAIAQYFIALQPAQSAEAMIRLVSLLHTLILGYGVMELTSAAQPLWPNQTEFVETLVALLAQGVEPAAVTVTLAAASVILDLPTPWVHTILQRAKQTSLQDYALAYVLFAAGLSAAEVVTLHRTDQISDPEQHLLLVRTGRSVRQVPVNQWILGKRYGSYTSNPLTRWLKRRSDLQEAMFLDAVGQPMTEETLHQHWQIWTADFSGSIGQPLTIDQAQQTWLIEMLVRGMTPENLSVLTGRPLADLEIYGQRAREKTALEQAILLDQKTK